MKKIGMNIAILLCFIASLTTLSFDGEVIKALITGGLIGIWLTNLVLKHCKKS